MWKTIPANNKIRLVEGIDVKKWTEVINKKGEFLHNQ
jgi:hypothetical protein